MAMPRFSGADISRRSHGYGPGKSAIDAVGKARERCQRSGWVLDLDIKGFFDSIDRQLILKAVVSIRTVRACGSTPPAEGACADAGRQHRRARWAERRSAGGLVIRAMSSVTAKALRKHAFCGARSQIVWRPASWCCAKWRHSAKRAPRKLRMSWSDPLRAT